MWLLTASGGKKILCNNQDDTLEYIKINKGIWTVEIVDVWAPPAEPKPKVEKYERPFKPMSQE